MLHLKMSMFDTFRVKKPQRSTFNLSHKHETTVNIGDINCLHWNWCYPGDRFKIRYSFLAKFAPMIAPNFSRMRLKSEVFYVPLSDICDDFHEILMNYKEESQTIRENGQSSTVYNTRFPSFSLSHLATWFEMTAYTSASGSYDELLGNRTKYQEFAVARLCHQMGIPFDVTFTGGRDSQGDPLNPFCNNVRYMDRHDGDSPDSGSYKSYFNPAGAVQISTFPFQAYQYVYRWYYADSVRTPEIDYYPALSRYLRGLQNSAGLKWQRFFAPDFDTFMLQSYYSSSLSDYTNRITELNRMVNSLFQIRRRFYSKDYFNTAVSDPTVGVDSIAVPDNIVDLRKANTLQKFIEKQALAGNRIAEFIMAHWAHKVDNYELGRPILISSSSQNVQISEVLQTSETTDESAQGTRSGNANSYGNSRGSFFVAPDYGVLLINMTIVPEISYFSGTPRKFTVSRWEHFAWPEFAQIGMQPIYNFELAAPELVTEQSVWETWPQRFPQLEDLPVFGYAPRYSEAKMELDQVSGEMATSLRFWHQSPFFDRVPGLNQQFGLIGFFDYNLLDNNSQFNTASYYNQIFANIDDTLADHCQIIANFDITVNRALPANDMPAL